MSGHSLAPWFYGVSGYPERGPQPLTYSGPGFYENGAIFSADGEPIVECGEYELFGPMLPRGRREANLRLMLLAPEMLTALEAFDEWARSDEAADVPLLPAAGKFMDALTSARSLIDRAREAMP